jgi:DNA-binding GntR family transcriptional regulator
VSVRRSNQQHLEIIEALRARDPLLAKMRTQTHIISTRPKAMVENSHIMLGLL